MPKANKIDFKITSYGNTRGLNTSLPASDIADADFSSILNMRFSRFGFGPRLGTSLVGTTDNTATTGINSAYVFIRADGTEFHIRSHSTFLEIYDDDNDKWVMLLSGLTSGLRFAFAPFNKTFLTTIDDRLIFGNGTDNYSQWNGAFSHIQVAVTAASTTIDLATGDGAYFGDSGSGLIDGDTFSWTGRSTDQLTGVTGITSAHAIGISILKNPDTITYSALPKMNILLTALGRLYGANNVQIRLFYSKSGDNTNFTSAANYGDPGLEDFPEGNGPILGLAARPTANANNIVIYKERGIYTLSLEAFSATSDATNKKAVRGIIEEGEDVGAASSLGIMQAQGEDYFITNTGGLHILGLTESGTLRPKSLTDPILPSIHSFDFSSAALGYDPREGYVMTSCRGVNAYGQVQKTNGTIILYDRLRAALSTWKGLNLSCFTYYKRKCYGHDVSDAKTYEMNVQGNFSDEIEDGTLNPFVCSAITKRHHYELPALKKITTIYYIQGYVLPSAKIKCDFRYNDGGSKTTITKIISGSLSNAYVFKKPSHIFGSRRFGDLAFGAEESDLMVEGMNPFRVYCGLPVKKHFDLEVMFYSDEGDGNGWWITYSGAASIALKELDQSLFI